MTTAKGITVIVGRGAATGSDRYGGATVTRTPHTIEHCVVGLRTNDPLDAEGREGSVLGVTLYCPPGADVQHSPIADLITIDGDDWETDGEPFEWRNGYSDIVRGVQVPLKRVQG